MRPLGTIDDEQLAQAFCDLLYLENIEAEFDEDDGTIWIVDEDQMESAKTHFATFKVAPPDNERVIDLHLRSETQRERAFQEDERAATLQKTSRDLFKGMPGGMGRYFRNKPGPLTIALLALSILVTLISVFGKAEWALEYLYIAKLTRTVEGWSYLTGFRELRGGQVWRLITPIFLHLSVLHIALNMWWLYDLGALLERRKGWPLLLGLVLTSALGSNLLQALIEGPVFGGMSGVVFALFGYAWIMSDQDPDSGIDLQPTIGILMGLWLLLGFLMPNLSMANYAHLGGILIGVGFAFAELFIREQRA